MNATYHRTGTLWEGRFKSSLVESERYLLTCIRHIELNPVRVGLVAYPGAYPWSSYRHHAMGAPARQTAEAGNSRCTWTLTIAGKGGKASPRCVTRLCAVSPSPMVYDAVCERKTWAIDDGFAATRGAIPQRLRRQYLAKIVQRPLMHPPGKVRQTPPPPDVWDIPTDFATNYALGWFTKDAEDGQTLLWHGGQGFAFNAVVVADLPCKHAIFLATNAEVPHMHPQFHLLQMVKSMQQLLSGGILLSSCA